MGGQSAFGTKAGDTFTKITIVTAIIWIVLCTTIYWTLKHRGYKGIGDSFSENIPAATVPANAPTSDSVTSTPDTSPVAGGTTEASATDTPVTTPIPVSPESTSEKKPE
jgi:preprotein translocase subunit SecG